MRKSFAFFAMSMVLLFSSEVYATGSNLLTNPDFENGLNGWGINGPNWQAQSVVVFPDGGAISAQNTIGEIAGQDYFASLSQSEPHSPGQAIYATLQVKTDINVLSSARAGVLIEFRNGGGALIEAYQDETGGLTDWKELYVSAVAPSGTATVTFHAFVFATEDESQSGGVANGGNAYFDVAVMQLRQIPPPPNPTLLSNPGFENGYVDWSFFFQPALEVDDQEFVEGFYSGKNTISMIAGQDFFAAAYQDLEYVTGPVFASAQIQTSINPTSTGLAGLKLEFYDQFDPPSGTTPLGSEEVTLLGNNNWTRVVIDGGGGGVTPPVGTLMIRVLALTFAVQGDNGAVGGVANFDDIIFSYDPLPPDFRTDILNEGFENGLNYWSDLFGFPTEISTNAHSGALAGLKSIGILPGQDYFSQVYQDIYFDSVGTLYPPQTPVYATAYVSTDMDPITKSQAGLQLEFIDINGDVIEDMGEPIVITDSVGGQTDWRYLYTTAETPVGTQRVRVSGNIFAREQDASFLGDGYYDDFEFSLTPLPPPDPQSELINPGFENGLNDWDEDNKPGEVTDINVHSGMYAAEYTIDDDVFFGDDYFGTACQDLQTVGGNASRVRASGWVETDIDPITTSTAGIQLQFFDDMGQQMGPTHQSSVGGQTPYTKLTLVKQTPVGAKTVRFCFFLFGDDVSALPGDKAYFDDANVVVGPKAHFSCAFPVMCP